MPKNEHVALLGRGAAAWNEWRAEHGKMPDLSRAALRGLLSQRGHQTVQVVHHGWRQQRALPPAGIPEQRHGEALISHVSDRRRAVAERKVMATAAASGCCRECWA